MRRESPDIAVRVEVDTASRLLERVQDGSLDVAVLYNPPSRPDLVVELVSAERLVLVTTDEQGVLRPEDYVYVDWGEPFAASHDTAFPELANAAVSISLGPLALNYILAIGGAGYFRSAIVQPYLDSRQLQPVARAPEFSYSCTRSRRRAAPPTGSIGSAPAFGSARRATSRSLRAPCGVQRRGIGRPDQAAQARETWRVEAVIQGSLVADRPAGA